ncbi:nucleotidyltransferase family protein [Candidatus Pacearchaeota archaeon]|nr:nucleotidyltransferase family protein [Candidatus Pacearchaeota archaeon]
MKKSLQEIKKKIVPLLQEHNVTKAGIFGSYARGDEKKGSDVDILIEMNDGKGLMAIIALKMLLEKRLKRKVDLVEYSTIRKELKSRILNEEIPIIR